MARRDYYKILGVDRDADQAAIKRAYRRLVLRYHPDRNKVPRGAARFLEIQEAYTILSDPEKRRLYELAQPKSAPRPSQTGRRAGLYPDGMVEHDGMVGELLKKLDDLKIAGNTIVVYGTDNGAEVMSWPDGGTTPFKGEKATNWEGGFRTPCLIRWPGVIKPGTIYNDFFAHEDFLPTFAAAAGDPDVVAKCLKGFKAGSKSFHVHLDGYNLMPFFKGEVKESPRHEFLYWSDDGDLMAIRVNQWKISFKEQHATGLDVWKSEFTNLRAPNVYNLRADPFERGTEGFGYDKWMADRAFLIVPSQAIVARWLETFKEFPIRQKPASFSLDEVMQKLSAPQSGGR